MTTKLSLLSRKGVNYFANQLRTLGILALLVLGGGLLAQFRLLDGANALISDLRFQLGSRPVTGGIVLIDIDAKSLQAVGVWPWPRTLYAELVRKLESMGVAQIAFDVDFSARSNPAADSAFAGALNTASVPVFLAALGQRTVAGGSATTINQPVPELRAGGWPALVNVPLDTDGLVRQFPSELLLDQTHLQSMPVLLAAQDRKAPVNIDYAIRADRLAHYSFSDVLGGKVPSDAMKGKSAVVGASALELRDFLQVPRYGTIPGSEIIALATETLLQGRDIVHLPSWYVLLTLGLVAGALFVFWRDWRVVIPLTMLLLSTEATGAYLQVVRAQSLPTAGGDLIIAGLIVSAIAREFGLRQLLLKLARRETLNTRRMLERVVEDAYDAIIILNEADRTVRRNEAARRLFEADELDGDSLPEPVIEAIGNARRKHADGLVGSIADEAKLARPGGEPRFLEYTVTPFNVQPVGLRRLSPVTYIAVTLRNITDRRLAAETTRYLAMHDTLTGLLNRRGFEDLLRDIDAVEAQAGGLIYFDLDRFKAVNDAYGHALGDRLLIELASRARLNLPPDAAIARMGGDEFAAFIGGTNEHFQASAAALLEAIGVPFVLDGHSVGVSASLGVSFVSTADGNASMLLRQPGLALQAAKAQGGSRIVLFHPSLEEEYQKRLLLEQDLEVALAQNEFELAFQPQVDLRSGVVTGAEALLRWRHLRRGMVSPALFIPVAEEAGLIHRITAWVLEEACKVAATWPQPIVVAVNLSAIDLQASDMLALIDGALASSGLPPSRLELEITETALMTGSATVTKIFEAVRARGIRFAIDDFGTGYSSLSYLHRYPFSMLKIDKSFVDNGPTDAEAMTILGSVIGMARALGLKSLAEGIETEEQLQALRLLGCERGQGYLFSKPLPDGQFRTWLGEWHANSEYAA